MRYEKMETRYWTEPDLECWSPAARLLYVWAMTNPIGNGICGITQASPSQIKLQTGLTPLAQERAFAEIGDRIKRYAGGWVWLRERFSYACESSNHWKSAVNFLEHKIVPKALSDDFWARYANDPDMEQHRTTTRKAGASEGPSEALPGTSPPTPLPLPLPPPTEESTDTQPDTEPAETASERRLRQAGGLIDFYRQNVKPFGDSSRTQAVKNVIKLLKSGIDIKALARCVARYKDEMEATNTEPTFRKNAGNFFGREAVYEQYLPDDWVEPEWAPPEQNG